MPERKLAGNAKILFDVEAEDLNLVKNGNAASLRLEVIPGQRTFFQVYDERKEVIEALKGLGAIRDFRKDQLEAIGEKRARNVLKEAEKKVMRVFLKNASVFSELEENRISHMEYTFLVLREPEEQKPESCLSDVRFHVAENARFWTRSSKQSWTYFNKKTSRDGTKTVRTDFLIVALTAPSRPFSVLHQEDEEDGKRVETLYEMNSGVNIKTKIFQEVSDKENPKTTKVKKK